MTAETASTGFLLISETFPPKTGGSGRWFWEVYRRMPRSDVRIAAGEHLRQREFDRNHDLRVVRMPLTFQNWGILNVSGILAYRDAVRRLTRLVRDEPVAMVHCGRCLPEGLVGTWIQRATGVPFLCYAHGEEMNYAKSSRELGWLTRHVLGAAEYIVANSRNTAGILRKEWGLDESKLRILHPGVDTSRFVPAARDSATRATLGWGNRPVVLTVGRLQRRKGHDRMICAVDAIRRSVRDVLYAIVGDGEERMSLEALVARRGLGDHVQFLGELDDPVMLRCYQQCDVFTLPNRQEGQDIEGFGIVLLEAQACGKPVVAGTSGGTAETMKIPETGLVVSCETPDELGFVVAGLLADRQQRERMGRAARQWAVEHFDWEVLSRRAERLFRGESADEADRVVVGSAGA